MTKQEFFTGMPFRLNGELFRFELVGTDGIITKRMYPGDFYYWANIDLNRLTDTGVTVFGTWMGVLVEKILVFEKLNAEPAKTLATPR